MGGGIELPDAILVRSHDLHAMAIPRSVKAVARAGAGTNNIPVAALSQRGVPVFNAPGANANAVKELVLTALLMSARHVVPALDFVRTLPLDAPDYEARVEAGKKAFAGIELPNRTLGLLGLGAVGGLGAETALKLGMHVLGYDPEITVEAAWRLPSSVRKAHSIEEVLRQSEFVSLHLPLLPATRGLIGAQRLACMPPGAVLLNFARDAIVDAPAVAAALCAGRLFLRFPVAGAGAGAGRGRTAAPGRVHRGGRGPERDDGGGSAARLPRRPCKTPGTRMDARFRG